MIKIYHNNRCGKSRCALDILKEQNEDYEIIEYLKKSLNVQEIEELLEMLGIGPIALIRKGESVYKEFFKGKVLSDTEWIKAMVDHPILIERPIVVKNGKAVIGRPTELVSELIKN
jgi:arsenate reductase